MNGNSINFLGGSQTFLGTLATIIILFIVIDSNNTSSNLIQYILMEVKDKVEAQIKNLIHAPYKKITDGIHYDDIVHRLKAGINNQELEKEANMLLAEIKQKQDAMLLRRGAKAQYYDAKKSDGIVHAKELSFAPLYSFLFCLLIFVYDELLRSYTFSLNYFLLNSLLVFIALSDAVWCWMWTKNLLRIRGIIYEDNKWEQKRFCKLFKFSKIEATYMAQVKSFVWLLFLSFLLAFILKRLDDIEAIQCIFYPYTTAKYFKISIFAFIFLNGIVLPFFIPYCEYKIYLRWAINRFKKDDLQADEFNRTYIDRLTGLYSRLKAYDAKQSNVEQ